MRSIRSRLDALERSAPAPLAFRFLTQHAAPDGRRVPADADVDREAERLKAEGFAVRIFHVVYTDHSLARGHGPAEWSSPPAHA